MSKSITFRRRRLLQLAGCMFLLVSSVFSHADVQTSIGSQTANAKQPAFDVASIKPGKSDDVRMIQIRGRRFATTGTTLIDLLKYCYGVHASQIVDGPDWMEKQKFDILADPGTEVRPASDEMKKMVQGLLADRFHLVFHRAKRELGVYAIEPAKNGPKLTKSTADPNGIPVGGYTPGWLDTGNVAMTDFATFLQRYVTDRPVVDQTGIPGKYNLSLHWTPDDSPSDAASKWPGLFTAIQEQLGLKLVPMKASAEVFVLEHVEMPSED